MRKKLLLILLLIPLSATAFSFSDLFKWNKEPLIVQNVGDSTINRLDQWASTSTPVTAISQRVWGTPVKLTGLTSLLSLCVSADGIATTTGCTSSGLSSYDAWTHPAAGTSATTSNIQITGSTTLQNFTFVNATGSAATTSNFHISSIFNFGGDVFDELVGDGLDTSNGDLIFDCSDVASTGLQCSGEDLQLNATGDWTGTVDGNNFAGGAIGAGDLLYGASAGSIAELTLGTAGFVLASSNGLPAWVSTSSIPLLGDVTGTLGAAVVGNDSHDHTGATLSGIDISGDTNLTAGDGLTLTDDDLDCDTSSASVFGCLSAANWTTFNSKLGAYDAWTHPQAGTSATTSNMIFGAASSTVVGNLNITGNSTSTNASTTNDFYVGGTNLGLGTNGVLFSHDGDGALTITGNGAGSDEDLVINLDDTSNAVVLSSGSGAATLQWLGAGVGSNFRLGSNGVQLSDDNDGALTIAGVGTGADENLIFNFDDTVNEVDITSGTGVLDVDWNTLNLKWQNSTSSSATTTNLFSETASSTNLFASVFNFGSSILSLVASTLTAGANAIIDFGSAVSFEIPNGSDLTVDATGEIAVDTTSGQLKYYDSRQVRIITATSSPAFTLASTTLDALGNSFGSGTTTRHLKNWPHAITLNGWYCDASSTGSVLVRFGDGTNWSNAATCNTTGAFSAATTNNTFTTYEDFVVQIGTSATNPSTVTITTDVSVTAD